MVQSSLGGRSRAFDHVVQCLQLVVTNEACGLHEACAADARVTKKPTTLPDELLLPVLVEDTHTGNETGIVVCQDGVVHIFGLVLDLTNSEGILLEVVKTLFEQIQEPQIGVFAN